MGAYIAEIFLLQITGGRSCARGAQDTECAVMCLVACDTRIPARHKATIVFRIRSLSLCLLLFRRGCSGIARLLTFVCDNGKHCRRGGRWRARRRWVLEIIRKMFIISGPPKRRHREGERKAAPGWLALSSLNTCLPTEFEECTK